MANGGLLLDYILKGAGAPSSHGFPGSGTTGVPSLGDNSTEVAQYLNTTNNHLYTWDGTAWQDTTGSGGGSGAMTHLGEVIVAGSVAASASFNSISGSYRHLLVTAVMRGDTAAFHTNLQMQFNGDTGSNYKWVYSDVYTSGGDSAASNGDTSITLGKMQAASCAANVAGSMRINIYDYARTAWFKPTDSQFLYSSSDTFANSGATNPGTGNARWLSTSAITDILLKPAAGNFAIGSIFTLFGIL